MIRFPLIIVVLTLTTVVANAEDGVGPEYYPGIGFTVLDQQERHQFIDMAETQTCPCPGEPRTLSACLQDVLGRCGVAVEVASLMMRRLKEDMALNEIQVAVERRVAEATTPRTFDLEHNFYRGSPEAPLQLVVFSDFECPFCRVFATTLDMLTEQYGDQLCIYFKHFPLPQHANAEPAARAVNAAGQQGRFWEMHDLLFESQSELRDTSDPLAIFLRLAGQLDLDVDRFVSDLNDTSLAALPGRDRAEAQAAGVNSTPTLFINGVKFRDEGTLGAIQAHLNALIAEGR